MMDVAKTETFKNFTILSKVLIIQIDSQKKMNCNTAQKPFKVKKRFGLIKLNFSFHR